MYVEFKRKSRVKSASAFLQKFRNKVTSQAGEDGLIEKIFEIAGTTNQYCIEFGAWNGKHNSNTWNLLKNKGWSGLLIEANEARFAELEVEYADHEGVTSLNGLVETAGEQSLDAILARVGAPDEPDLLCIDIDGMDWHIWKSLTKFAPRLVVIEFNPSMSSDVIYIQDDDPSVFHGCSLLALIELGKLKGYELVATTEFNGLFVKQELYPAFGIEDNDIDSMHDMSIFESRLLQCYDGTLVLAGCRRLLWTNTPIAQEDIQVLPAALRTYKA
jgi:hypothetical protein